MNLSSHLLLTQFFLTFKFEEGSFHLLKNLVIFQIFRWTRPEIIISLFKIFIEERQGERERVRERVRERERERERGGEILRVQGNLIA